MNYTMNDHHATNSSENTDQSFSPVPVMVVDEELLQDIGTDEDLEQQQQQGVENNQYSVDMGQWNRDWQLQQLQQEHEQEGNAEQVGGEAPLVSKPPPRKTTSNSEATSLTAASSFLDDDSSFFESIKPTLSATSTTNNGKKPRLDSLDELPEGLSYKDDSVVAAGDDVDNQSHGSSSTKNATEDSRCWIWFKRVLLFLVIFGAVAFFAVLIGAAIEKRHFADADGTTHLYKLPQVCGVTDPKTDAEGITFDSVQQAHDAGSQIAHCGDCGACSTARDMAIMTTTADSLTRDSTRCAFKIFIGRRAVQKCMEERVGFTRPCEDCWLDNISCSFRACKFTCIKYKLFRQDNNKGGAELNDCLKCDERMCGPEFIECSGSNRRRMGIVSDIGRDADNEQCQSVDVDWLHLYD